MFFTKKKVCEQIIGGKKEQWWEKKKKMKIDLLQIDTKIVIEVLKTSEKKKKILKGVEGGCIFV